MRKPTKELIFYVSVSLFVCAISYYLITGFQAYAYQLRYLNCIDYLAAGTLYEGNADCAQPPVVYIVGYLFSLAGERNIQPLSSAFFIIIHAYCLTLILEVLKPKSRIILASVSLVYCFLIIPISVRTSFGPDLATMLSAMFILSAYYLLHAGGWQKQIRQISILLSLAFFSKSTALFPVLGMFMLCLFPAFTASGKKGGIVCFYKGTTVAHFVRGVYFLTPFVIPLIIVLAVYPQFLVYGFLAQPHDNPDVIQKVHEMVFNPFQNDDLLVLFPVLFFMLILYIRRREDLTFLTLFSTLIPSLALFSLSSENVGLFDSPRSYYIIYSSMFLLLLVGRWFSGISEGSGLLRLCVLFICASLFFGGFRVQGYPAARELASMQLNGYGIIQVFGDLSELDSMRSRINHAYSFLPPAEGMILSDEPMYDVLLRNHAPIQPDRVDYLSAPQDMAIDGGYLPGLERYGAWKSLNYTLNEKDALLVGKIEGGQYGSIFIGPAESDTRLWQVLRNVSKTAMRRYCTVYLPLFTDNKAYNPLTVLFFSDPSSCRRLRDDARAYFESVFDGICVKDEWVANVVVRRVFSQNMVWDDGRSAYTPVVIGKECSSNAEIIGKMERTKHYPGVTLYGLVLFLCCLFMISRSGARTRHRRYT